MDTHGLRFLASTPTDAVQLPRSTSCLLCHAMFHEPALVVSCLLRSRSAHLQLVVRVTHLFTQVVSAALFPDCRLRFTALLVPGSVRAILPVFRDTLSHSGPALQQFFRETCLLFPMPCLTRVEPLHDCNSFARARLRSSFSIRGSWKKSRGDTGRMAVLILRARWQHQLRLGAASSGACHLTR